jgi:hypothetical protein
MALAPTYCSHGSLHELDVPLVIFNQSWDLTSTEDFKANLDLPVCSIGKYIIKKVIAYSF